MSIVKIGNEHVLLTCVNKLQVRDVEAFMTDLRSVKGLAVQAVNADLTAGMQHIKGVIQQSIEAKKRRILLSRRIEVDILLRLACTNQISKAVIGIGLKNGTNNVLVIAVGRINHLRMLRKHIAENYGLDDKISEPSKRQHKRIASLHGISKEELAAIVGDSNKLARILVERASLL